MTSNVIRKLKSLSKEENYSNELAGNVENNHCFGLYSSKITYPWCVNWCSHIAVNYICWINDRSWSLGSLNHFNFYFLHRFSMFSVRRDIIASYVGVNNNMTSAISKLLKYNLHVLLLVIIWTYSTCWKWAVYHRLWMASFIYSTWPMVIWPTCCSSSSLADLPWYFLGILRWGHHHTPTTHHTTQPITTPTTTTHPQRLASPHPKHLCQKSLTQDQPSKHASIVTIHRWHRTCRYTST